jgi:hypothetical protein
MLRNFNVLDAGSYDVIDVIDVIGGMHMTGAADVVRSPADGFEPRKTVCKQHSDAGMH